MIIQRREVSAAALLKQELSGAPPPEPPQWYDRAIEAQRGYAEYQARRDARRQADEAALNAPHTAAAILHNAMTGNAGSPLPLNGARLIRAAMSRVGATPDEGNE